MREMSKWNSMSDVENGVTPVGVEVRGRVFPAGPGHFGREVRDARLSGTPVRVYPLDACTALNNAASLKGNFAVAQRGQCTFAQKVRNIQNAGAKLAIVVDNVPDSTHTVTAMFAMSGDGKDDIEIPAVFLFTREGDYLLDAMNEDPELIVTVGELKSLKRQYENTCDDDNCEAVLETSSGPAESESFDHLKKVLSQLVAQFELSLSHDESSGTQGQRCGNEVLEQPFQNDIVYSKEGHIEDLPAVPVERERTTDTPDALSDETIRVKTAVNIPGEF